MTDEFEVVRLRAANEKPDAADWLAKLDRGKLTAEERAAFTRWLAEDPRNKHALKEAATLWYGLNAPLSKLSPELWSSARAMSSRVPARMWAVLIQSLGGPKGRTIGGVIGGFATIMALAYFMLNPGIATGYYATKVGETRVVSLSDGSKITLNTDSIVEQNFSRQERVIRLISGEALFDVAHDRGRPFLVYAVDGVIRAVGTRFAVRVEPNKVSVMVAEGRISVGRRADDQAGAGANVPAKLEIAKPILVGHGEAAEIDRGAGAKKESVSKRELSDRLSWTQGRLVFHDRGLQSVVDEVARYTTVRIEVADDALKARKITGVLPVGNINQMIEGIEAALNVKAEWISPNLVRLTES